MMNNEKNEKNEAAVQVSDDDEDDNDDDIDNLNGESNTNNNDDNDNNDNNNDDNNIIGINNKRPDYNDLVDIPTKPGKKKMNCHTFFKVVCEALYKEKHKEEVSRA